MIKLKINKLKSITNKIIDKEIQKTIDEITFKMALEEADKKNRIALEEYAIQLKERGILKLEGENFTLLLN